MGGVPEKFNAWVVSVLLICSGGSGIAHGWNWTGPGDGIAHSTCTGRCVMVGTRRSASGASSAVSGTTTPPEADPPAAGATQNAPASSMDVVEASESPPAAPPALGKRPTKTITAEAKDALLKHFKLAKYNRNDKMPRRNVDKALDGILDKYGLTRGQGSRQLAKYRLGKKLKVKKMRRYKKSQLKDIFTVFFDRDEIVEFLDILTCDDKKENDAAYGDYFSPNELTMADHLRLSNGEINDVVRALAADTECPFADMLLEMTDFYADTAAEVFPAVSKSLSGSDQQFLVKRNEERKEVARSKDWKSMMPLELGMDAEAWANVYAFIEDCLFICWSRRLQLEEDARSPLRVVIPKEDRVSKYASGIVYYTGSWLLSQLMTTKKIGDKEKKAAFASFAEAHNLSKDDALKAELPTGVVDRRERKSLCRISAEGYQFIRQIESAHIENLTLPMMLRYPGGDLPSAITSTILNDKDFIKCLEQLCLVDGVYIKGLEREAMRKALLEHILLKFSHMRGREFERTIKGQSSRGQTGVHRTTTRMNVTVQSEASREAKSREGDLEARLLKQMTIDDKIEAREDETGGAEEEQLQEEEDRRECEEIEDGILSFPADTEDLDVDYADDNGVSCISRE